MGRNMIVCWVLDEQLQPLLLWSPAASNTKPSSRFAPETFKFRQVVQSPP